MLTSAAQRVAQEAQSQVVASPNEAGPELQALAKQQHVLTITAQAFHSKTSGEPPDGSAAQSNALAAAAQQVVLQAARQVAALADTVVQGRDGRYAVKKGEALVLHTAIVQGDAQAWGEDVSGLFLQFWVGVAGWALTVCVW